MNTIIILLPGILVAYDMICPYRSQLQLRNQGLCAIKNLTNSEYSCLEDVSRQTFTESCSEEEDVVRPGRRYVFKGQTTSSVCSTDRYQPIKFYKTSGAMCIFLKSTCTEAGQVIARQGSDIADTTCICDYTEGYLYVNEPNDICNCVPSEEDCTCYQKLCPENHFLSAEDACIHRNATSRTKCATVDQSGKDVTVQITTVFTAFNISEPEAYDISSLHGPAGIIVLWMIIPMLICIRIIIKHTEYFTKTLNTVCIAGDNAYLECEVIDDNQTAQWFKDGTKLRTSNKYTMETIGKLHRLVVYNAEPDDEGEYSVKIKYQVQRSELTVREYFTKTLDSQNCIEGNEAHFECKVLDDNQKARWCKDGIELSLSNKYKIETHGKYHRLVVYNTKPDDQGKYTVTIKNRVQQSELTVRVSKCTNNEEEEMTILVMGATGAGKTTFIDAMINYIAGVSCKDDYRLKIVDLTPDEERKVKEQHHSQTNGITMYKIPKMEGFAMNFALNVIDTRGFGSTGGIEEDKKIPELLEMLFETSVETLNAVCLVTPLSVTRLGDTEKYIFEIVMNIFGKDVKDNIYMRE